MKLIIGLNKGCCILLLYYAKAKESRFFEGKEGWPGGGGGIGAEWRFMLFSPEGLPFLFEIS